MAQKVGEEAVEMVIEAKDNNQKLFLNEAADLMTANDDLERALLQVTRGHAEVMRPRPSPPAPATRPARNVSCEWRPPGRP